MAITKRFKVSFDVKAVLSTELEKEFKEMLVGFSKAFLEGKKLSGFELEMARVAAQYGPEAAIELAFKSSYSKSLKEEMIQNNEGETVKISNVAIRVTQ